MKGKMMIVMVLAAVVMAACGKVEKADNTANNSHMDNKPAGHHIVFQFSAKDTTMYKGFIKQLNNVYDGMEAELEVVILGPGIALVQQGSPYMAALQALNERGVKFLVCSNTMKVKKLEKEDILPFAEVVPMGIGHLVKRQEEGWSYIKAGF